MTLSPNRRAFLGAAAAAGAAALLGAPPAQAAASRGNRYALQKRFVDWRFGMFLHFNMGTYHDAEWVEPDQAPQTFAPVDLDCGQWADAAKAAGMKFGVLTAKHHDGFCLWPSKHISYSVASSPVRGRDIVREYVHAFRSRGLAPCLYFSIWDRTNGVGPAGFDDRPPITREAIAFVKNQLTELLTGYGPIPLLIFDGWAWHWAFGHRSLPFHEIRDHVAALQPDCLVLDLNGLSVPWHSELLFVEKTKGGVFCPPGNTYAASQGQTISLAGCFWHPSTPTTLLTAEEIVDGHLKVLEPRYCTFILNCPPNPRGLLDDTVVQTLREVGRRWRPDRTRPPLPPQPDVVLHPLTPAGATATSGDAALAVDGHSDFGWNGQADQTLWTSDAPPSRTAPQAVTLDLGRVYAGVDVLTYLPRQDTRKDFVLEDFHTDGNITSYRVAASTDGRTFRTVAQGDWPADHTLKHAVFQPTTARYLRLEAFATSGDATAMASRSAAAASPPVPARCDRRGGEDRPGPCPRAPPPSARPRGRLAEPSFSLVIFGGPMRSFASSCSAQAPERARASSECTREKTMAADDVRRARRGAVWGRMAQLCCEERRGCGPPASGRVIAGWVPPRAGGKPRDRCVRPVRSGHVSARFAAYGGPRSAPRSAARA